ncbi:hypothetical protein LINGRAHAP2_LOCUS37312 [Linum grandiflorum]
MVEILSSSNYMLTLCQSRAGFASVASAFAFGSCKEGWYHRCQGVDP